MQCNNFHHHSGTVVQRKCGRSMFFFRVHMPRLHPLPACTSCKQEASCNWHCTTSDPCPVTVRAKGTARVCIYRFTAGSVAFRRDRGHVRSTFASLSLQSSCCPPSKRPSKARGAGTACPKDESDKLRLARCQKCFPPLTVSLNYERTSTLCKSRPSIVCSVS